MMQKIRVTLMLSALVVVIMCSNVKGRPSESPLLNSRGERNSCSNNDRYEDTCQRCAKITKSPLVYPLCCKNNDNVYDWCEEYVYFGDRVAQ